MKQFINVSQGNIDAYMVYNSVCPLINLPNGGKDYQWVDKSSGFAYTILKVSGIEVYIENPNDNRIIKIWFETDTILAFIDAIQDKHLKETDPEIPDCY